MIAPPAIAINGDMVLDSLEVKLDTVSKVLWEVASSVESTAGRDEVAEAVIGILSPMCNTSDIIEILSSSSSSTSPSVVVEGV